MAKTFVLEWPARYTCTQFSNRIVIRFADARFRIARIESTEEFVDIFLVESSDRRPGAHPSMEYVQKHIIAHMRNVVEFGEGVFGDGFGFLNRGYSQLDYRALYPMDMPDGDVLRDLYNYKLESCDIVTVERQQHGWMHHMPAQMHVSTRNIIHVRYHNKGLIKTISSVVPEQQEF